MSTILDAHQDRGVRCLRCASAGNPQQLSLFEAEAYYTEGARLYDGAAAVNVDHGSGWPDVETSHCRRVGFWRERSLTVFGHRIGVGPLIVMPDTNILIALRDELEEAEGGLILHPLWGDHENPTEALRELVQLWWWRDLRFAVSSLHLADSPKPLVGDRQRAREDAVRELGQDYNERGGSCAVVADELLAFDQPCPLHSIPLSGRATNSVTAKAWTWPKDQRDRELVKAAYDAGCHVFLTADKAILKCHESLSRQGLAILTSGQLLSALDETGELDSTRGGDFLVPDLSTLTRLYAGFSN